jgi:hypothetical protein
MIETRESISNFFITLIQLSMHYVKMFRLREGFEPGTTMRLQYL